jgi:hypothetical protein
VVGDLGERSGIAVQRVEGHEHDALDGAVVDDVLVRALGQVVTVLDSGDRHDPAGLLDLVDPDLADADVPDLAVVHVLLDRREALLERRLGVDSVQVVERDALGPKPAQALLDLGSELLGPTLTRSEAALRPNDAVLGDRRQRSAECLLALASGVEVSGVEVSEPGGDGLLDQRDVLGCVREAIRPEPDARELDACQPDRSRRQSSASAGRGWRLARSGAVMNTATQLASAPATALSANAIV